MLTVVKINPISQSSMSTRETQAMKSLEVALDNALSRLNQLKGKDRLALASEYKEWLVDDELTEQVWFCTLPQNKLYPEND